ncbi:porin family protein [Cesiribacter andamanensis]|uniref:Outer membrane protein beta-barrel domain-containing protein n=1 Tax=Cesiribacter andamanensis AMV16 TaxID=1279009 RepID=M7N5Y6_9BACT|nr:porin family protein [Cesiribacter andamanensis]EMR02651.1 hypothetical protein ADICEAN_02190 [Cesiribacter andamanensis AMV16]
MLLATTATHAQAQLGLRAGLTVTTISDGVAASSAVAGDGEEPWKPGLVAGIASSFALSQVVAIAPELTYSQRGYRLDGPENIDIRYNYLELPVLGRLLFGQNLLKGYVNLGPTVSYLLSGRRDVAGTTTGAGTSNMEYRVSDSGFSRFELGGAVGGGIQLNTGAGSFLIDLRYTQGFTDFRKEGFDEPYLEATPEEYKNRGVSVSLIYLIPGLGLGVTPY